MRINRKLVVGVMLVMVGVALSLLMRPSVKPAYAMGAEPLLGSIAMAPYEASGVAGWAECKGQLLPISENQALYAVLGNRFGGDGYTNFQLPNIPAMELKVGGQIVKIKYYIALEGVFPQFQ